MTTEDTLDDEQRQIEADLALLSSVADQIDHNKAEGDRLLNERNQIIRRLFDAGVQQVRIARAARRSAMAVALALGGGDRQAAPRKRKTRAV